MWMIFFIGFVEILTGFSTHVAKAVSFPSVTCRRTKPHCSKANLPAIFKKTALIEGADVLFLPSLIKRIITVFQTTNSSRMRAP